MYISHYNMYVYIYIYICIHVYGTALSPQPIPDSFGLRAFVSEAVEWGLRPKETTEEKGFVNKGFLEFMSKCQLVGLRVGPYHANFWGTQVYGFRFQSPK